MKRALSIAIVGGALAGLSGVAAAHGNVGFSVSIGAPIYAPPVYYTAPPVYYSPPPVYYAPPPAVYVPPRVYYGPPRMYGPPAYYYGRPHHRHRDHRR